MLLKEGSLKKVIISALAIYSVLLLIVWFVHIEFTACTKDNIWCSFSYWVTQSAGKYGTVSIIILCSVFYSIRFDSWREKGLNFLKSVVALVIFLAVFAWVNEHITKKAARIARPSHTYIFENSQPTISLDSLYYLNKSDRQKYLNDLITANENNFKNFDPKVLDHWVEEAGYSFPSGHSFNAFLLATVLAFGLIESRRKIANYIWFLPLLWAPIVAISRVAIGAHSALDVSFGAGMGILVAGLALYFDNTRRLIIHRKKSH